MVRVYSYFFWVHLNHNFLGRIWGGSFILFVICNSLKHIWGALLLLPDPLHHTLQSRAVSCDYHHEDHSGICCNSTPRQGGNLSGVSPRSILRTLSGLQHAVATHTTESSPLPLDFEPWLLGSLLWGPVAVLWRALGIMSWDPIWTHRWPCCASCFPSNDTIKAKPLSRLFASGVES